MKFIKIITCFFFILLITERIDGQEVRFLFIGKPGGDIDKQYLSRGLNDMFLTDAIMAFQEKFPCVGISDPVSTMYCIEELRLQSTSAFGGRDVVPIIKNMSTAISNGYKVRYSIFAISEEMAHADVKCEDKKGNVLVDFSQEFNIMSFINQDQNELCQLLIKKLSKYEICPYKGEISIKILSTKRDSQTEEYPVYCNGSDGMYRKTTTIDNYSENDWTIQKNEKNASTGNVKLTISEEFKVEEQNPCFECSPQKQGLRTYFEKITTKADIQGLSKESESHGIKVTDARTYITFLDDGTYTLRVTASSKQGVKKTTKEVSASGICKNINQKPKTITNKIDEGLNETFGPFTGTGLDKTLSHKDTIKRKNPTTGEEETIVYEFNLTRE